MTRHEPAGRPGKGAFAAAFRFFWAASYFLGIGIYLATTVVVCLWVGMKFDAWFDTAPTGRIVGIALAFPAALYSIYRKVKVMFGKRKE